MYMYVYFLSKIMTLRYVVCYGQYITANILCQFSVYPPIT